MTAPASADPATDPANADNLRAETLCLEAVDAVELFSLGEAPSTLATDLAGAHRTIEGLLLYCQLLEATNAIIRGVGGDIENVRAAARATARMWRTRVTS